MLKITKTEEHAMRLVMRLATQSGQRTLAELSALELLPEPTVAKLLGRLRGGGVVTAVRGRRGGYELARPATAISVVDVLRALKSSLIVPHSCQDDRPAAEPCPRLTNCGLRPVWSHVEAQVTGLLERITIADLLQAEARVHDRLAALWPPPAPILQGSRS